MPGFEMMGNPSGYFSDLENHTQIMLFADLAYQLASRYIGAIQAIVIITVFRLHSTLFNESLLYILCSGVVMLIVYTY